MDHIICQHLIIILHKGDATSEGLILGHIEYLLQQMLALLIILEQVEPQPMKKDRGEILRAPLVTNGGKIRSQARKKMHLSESRFSELLGTLVDYIETKPCHLNESWKVLILK